MKKLSRRGAILSILIGAVLKVYGADAEEDSKTFVAIRIPEAFPILGGEFTPCPSHDSTGTSNCATFKKNPDIPVEFALSVTYKGETIRITPEELMEALRGEK